METEETSTINKAKRLLIEKYDMTENEAHRFIRNRAMNERLRMYIIAKRILQEVQ